uniref:Ig-like domain-containing protein n=2 Tax=Arion vulgaris TaxID=1028688 RepID=A0A0B7ACC3_9EUPU
MEYRNRFINLSVIHLLLLFSTEIISQKLPIVTVKAIEDKGTFTITCDASRVQFPPEDSNITDIFGLILGINTTANPSITYFATYYPQRPAGQQTSNTTLPNRKWITNINGGQGNGTGNRGTIKIETLVPDAMCTDAGFYTCTVQYFSRAQLKPLVETQNVSAQAATKDLVLSLDPLNTGPNDPRNYSIYKLDTNVTITCRVDGPPNRFLKWTRERRPANGFDISYEDYPYANDISYENATQTGTGSCSIFRYISRLKLVVSTEDKNRTYQCVIQTDGVDGTTRVDVLTAGATINVETDVGPATPRDGGANTAGPNKSDTALIVGVVVGCVVAIIIIVVIVVCCIRLKRKNSKDHSDRPDGGAEEYRPPPMMPVTTRTSVNNRGSNALDGDERQNRQHDENKYRRKERNEFEPTENYDQNYSRGQKANGRHRDYDAQPENFHHATTNISQSPNEFVNQQDASGSERPKPKPKPKPKIQSQSSVMKDDGGQLHYAQLDLQPNRNEVPENPVRKKIHMPVQYSEISV